MVDGERDIPFGRPLLVVLVNIFLDDAEVPSILSILTAGV